MSELQRAQQSLAEVILDVARLARQIGTIETAVVAGAPTAGTLPVYLDGGTAVAVPAKRVRGPVPAPGERVVVWRRGRKLLVLGQVATGPGGGPFLTHAGTVSLVFAAASLVTGSPVVFPSPSFSQVPIVVWGKGSNGNKVVMQHSGLSTSGFTPVGATGDGSNYTGTVTGHWFAVQMSSTAAAG